MDFLREFAMLCAMWTTWQDKNRVADTRYPGSAPQEDYSLESNVERLVTDAKRQGMPVGEFLFTVKNWAMREGGYGDETLRVKLSILKAVETSVMRHYNIPLTPRRSFGR